VILVSCSIFTCLYFFRAGEGSNKLPGKLRQQKIGKGEVNTLTFDSESTDYQTKSQKKSHIDNQIDSQTDFRTGKGSNKFAGKLGRQKIDKGEVNKQKLDDKNLDYQTDSQTDSRQKSTISEEEEGHLITFYVSNLAGSPGSEGTFTIRTRPSWAPNGVQRFEELTKQSFWDGCRFFHAMQNFVHWGINGDPLTHWKWRLKFLEDEEVKASNVRGTVVFATSAKNTRTTQMYINTIDNIYFDSLDMAPIGTVVRGMDVVDQLYSRHEQRGGINEEKIQTLGNEYLDQNFPNLSFISKALFE